MDRLLSQALRIPLVNQDSDYDVCRPGFAEAHKPDMDDFDVGGSADRPCLLICPVKVIWTASRNPPLSHVAAKSCPKVLQNLESARVVLLASFVDHQRLVGRGIEIRNKNREMRMSHPETILTLQSDIDEWWISLPSDLQQGNQSLECGTLNLCRTLPRSCITSSSSS